jgi:hypothetical protein
MGERGKRKMARYEEFVDSSEGSAGRTRLSTTWSSLGGQKPCLPPLNPLGACPQENPARAVLAVPPSLCGARVLQTSFLVCPQMIGSPRGRRRRVAARKVAARNCRRWTCRTDGLQLQESDGVMDPARSILWVLSVLACQKARRSSLAVMLGTRFLGFRILTCEFASFLQAH